MRVCRKSLICILLFCLGALPRQELSAAGLFDRAAMLDVEQIRPGMRGYGKTVFQGTTIETFKITVIGVLKRIDAGGDAILIRVEDGPVVTKGYGIIAGMSGSPIYVNDKLIGALAFAWPFSKEPIAGVTPIRQMVDSFEPPPNAVAVSPQASMRFASRFGPIRIAGNRIETVVFQPRKAAGVSSDDQHTLVMQPVATPLMVTGISAGGLRLLERALEPYNVVPVAAPAGRGPEVRTPLIPGAAVGAQIMTGDMDFTAIGTVTYVSGDRVVAFGHPFLGMGALEMPMTTAFIHGVLSSAESSFKLGSAGVPLGAVTEDRSWCIGGKIGKRPDLIEALYQVTDKDRNASRRLEFQVIREKLLSPMLLMVSFGESMNNVIAPFREGTTEMKLTVKPEGLPEIKRENLFSTRPGGMFARMGASGPEGDMMDAFEVLTYNRFKQIGLERVQIEATFTTKRRTAMIEKVIASKTRVKPGDNIVLYVHLRPFEQSVTVKELPIQIPSNAKSGPIRVAIAGGEIAERFRFAFGLRPPIPQTLPQEIRLYEDQFRNDRIVVFIAMPAVGVEIRGYRLPSLPLPYLDVLRGAGSGSLRMLRDGEMVQFPEDVSVGGMSFVTVTVESEEPEKMGMMMPFGGEGPGSDESNVGPSETERVAMEGYEESASHPLRQWYLSAVASPERMSRYLPALRLGAKEEPLKKEEVDSESRPSMPSWEEVEEIDAEHDAETPGNAEAGAKSHKTKPIARPPKVWIQSAAKEFAKGKFDRTCVRSDDRVVLSAPLQVRYEDAKVYPMSQARDPSGNVYVATWLEPRILKVKPSGKASVFFQASAGAAISAVAVAGGFVYAAEAPTGIVHRISMEGSAQQFGSLSEPFVWSLLPDGQGGVLAGTGNEGKVYRIDSTGKVSVLTQLPDRHVLSMVGGKSGSVYAVTYPRGKVYRLSIQGKAETLYESSKTGALAVTVDQNENVYVGTSQRGLVYRISPDGRMKELFKAKERNIFTLAAGQDGVVYAGTGPRGNLYRITADGTATTMLRPQENYITSLQVTEEGSVFATTANLNQVLQLKPGCEPYGGFVSAPHEFETTAQLGRVSWEADVPEGSAVSVQTRSGNTAYPDKGWSEWSEQYVSPKGSRVTSPPGRFLQYRVNLYSTKGNANPAFRRIEMVCMNKNRPPEVRFKSPAIGDHISGKATLRWSAKDPDKDQLKVQTYYSDDEGKSWKEIVEEKKAKPPKGEESKPEDNKKPPAEAKPEEEPKETPEREPSRPQAKEDTSEPPMFDEKRGRPGPPGGPPLSMDRGEMGEPEGEVEAGSEPEETGMDFGSGAKQSRSWNTTKVRDGAYLLKVVVSDEISNPKDALKSEAICGPIVVDNTPPTIELPKPFTEIPKEVVRIKCSDALSRITSAEYRIDTGDWIAAAAGDGIFDETFEEVEVKPEHITAGKHTLKLRVRDSAGNEKEAELKYEIASPTREKEKTKKPEATKSGQEKKTPSDKVKAGALKTGQRSSVLKPKKPQKPKAE